MILAEPAPAARGPPHLAPTNLHDTVGLPWAWSIVALVVIVRMLLVPLTVRQIHSMQNLQAHAPEMKEIQQQYKGDRQKLNEELMKFYKENQINPAASCLPILAQFPVFIALFFVLRDFEKEILPKFPDADSLAEPGHDHREHEGRLGAAPGRLLRAQPADVVVPDVDDDAAGAARDAADPAARVHPVRAQLPSGLMLYWLTTNLWTTGQGLITRRLMPKPQPPPKKSSRTPPKADGRGGGSRRRRSPRAKQPRRGHASRARR